VCAICLGSFRGCSHCQSVKERMDGTASNFPAKNALGCRILHVQSRHFSGRIIPHPRSGRRQPRSHPSQHGKRRAPAWVFGPRHQFPLGSPAFPLFLFYETTNAIERVCKNAAASIVLNCRVLTVLIPFPQYSRVFSFTKCCRNFE